MSSRHKARQIAIFVEGDTERGPTGQRTLAPFFGRWLDPQLPKTSRVGIKTVKFQGVSNYLDDLVQKLEAHLSQPKTNFVIGLVDLYGLPPNRIDLSGCTTVAERVAEARKAIYSKVPKPLKAGFRQHFAVHEVEAWLLAYPDQWPPKVRGQISKRLPEEVNLDEPPAKFLKRILGGKYKKIVRAKNILGRVDPQIAIDKCPHLKQLANDLLRVARRLE
ncbi:MAG: DUF4276 family protein [Candidatus Nealsonbacteria bacterium]|nr:DUF4276 family protein [Candidatus Nealsonbacteria bacterium]